MNLLMYIVGGILIILSGLCCWIFIENLYVLIVFSLLVVYGFYMVIKSFE